MLDAGARVIHVDVMDGDFVPPITIGPLIVSAIADLVHDAGGAIDVHLMIERPEAQVAEFAAPAPTRSPPTSRRPPTPTGLSARSTRPAAAPGVALNPGTPVEALSEVAGSASCCSA